MDETYRHPNAGIGYSGNDCVIEIEPPTESEQQQYSTNVQVQEHAEHQDAADRHTPSHRNNPDGSTQQTREDLSCDPSTTSCASSSAQLHAESCNMDTSQMNIRESHPVITPRTEYFFSDSSPETSYLDVGASESVLTSSRTVSLLEHMLSRPSTTRQDATRHKEDANVPPTGSVRFTIDHLEDNNAGVQPSEQTTNDEGIDRFAVYGFARQPMESALIDDVSPTGTLREKSKACHYVFLSSICQCLLQSADGTATIPQMVSQVLDNRQHIGPLWQYGTDQSIIARKILDILLAVPSFVVLPCNYPHPGGELLTGWWSFRSDNDENMYELDLDKMCIYFNKLRLETEDPSECAWERELVWRVWRDCPRTINEFSGPGEPTCPSTSGSASASSRRENDASMVPHIQTHIHKLARVVPMSEYVTKREHIRRAIRMKRHSTSDMASYAAVTFRIEIDSASSVIMLHESYDPTTVTIVLDEARLSRRHARIRRSSCPCMLYGQGLTSTEQTIPESSLHSVDSSLDALLDREIREQLVASASANMEVGTGVVDVATLLRGGGDIGATGTPASRTFSPSERGNEDLVGAGDIYEANSTESVLRNLLQGSPISYTGGLATGAYGRDTGGLATGASSDAVPHHQPPIDVTQNTLEDLYGGGEEMCQCQTSPQRACLSGEPAESLNRSPDFNDRLSNRQNAYSLPPIDRRSAERDRGRVRHKSEERIKPRKLTF